MTIEIVAAECLFPAGPTIELADIAIKTQLALVRKHPLYVDRCGVPIKASFFPQLKVTGAARWETLANELLANLWKKLSALPAPERYRLWLILPPVDRIGVPAELEQVMVRCAEAHSVRWDTIRLLRGGAAQAGLALREIVNRQKENQKRNERVFDIVLGVECWLMMETLTKLDSERLLHGSYRFDAGEMVPEPYGFVPGEGAAAIVLGTGSGQGCCLSAAGIGQETDLHQADTACTGIGLASAAMQALQQVRTEQITHIVSDLNGEIWRADEYGFALTRLHAFLCRDDYIRVTPVLSSGDLGCASLVNHIAVIAWRYKQRTIGKDESTLILSSSPDSLRCAVVLTAGNL
ncbi:hypothetical protein [Mixta intestinalis]|uniref:Beta-ketoacyl synthase N-terminal domain-containing protein n=1 Tax=Mixta intestinalis TaxID=1615494 RepID=A0A6P1PXG1_9GAMM|nr:hypothetical protein [Mixta intestinalis]QHM71250.1 hypothetical protein C7M51_01535 [Mixta intestinalis]